jgi:polysaccharide export outer membrane protein
MTIAKLLRALISLFALIVMLWSLPLMAQDKGDADYRLTPGDVVRIMVFQDKSLQLDARVSDKGIINYPLAGNFEVGGLTTAAAEAKLAQLLQQGGIKIEARQVSLVLTKQHDVPQPAAIAGDQTGSGKATNDKADYRLGAGDVIRISVFQNPDLLLESRVSDAGAITYPLIGQVELGGLTVNSAEQKIAKMLRDGGFVVEPQISITLLQVRGNQVSVLGLVNHPGRFPLELANMKVTDVLALAGGIVPGAADNIVLVGLRDGKTVRKTIDIASMLMDGKGGEDVPVWNGDILYVNRAPMFYVYGEVQRPGSYRVERDMTLMQALAVGGGVTQRGTERGIKVFRRDEKTGKVEKTEPDSLQEPVHPDDVISVRESWF